MKITKVYERDNDELCVEGIDDNGTKIFATGWISAMNHKYDDDDYSTEDQTVEQTDIKGNVMVTVIPSGTLKPDATAREMTDKEKESYWLKLLEEASSHEKVLFEAKD